ncbi:sigma-70 family RNA polymerase sigma factor [Pedococcus sp. KACC 23699]|uniref:Sigma-70 family RNA polymerase sigma factor n=1 Tax=Pedococcus sp. KACC 23699 TaxID=3149228 RepID=A0AAU7JPX0_9MICO
MTAHSAPPDGWDGEGDEGQSLGDLLVRCTSGDEAAFEQVYAATAPRVFGLVLRIVVQHALAEEITQDVFSYVWAEAGRYEPSRGSGAGWILTIAHRRAVDRVRSVSASRTRDEVWTQKVTSAPFDSTAEAAHSSFEAARVRGALAALTLKQRTAVQLAYFHGLTYTEVAAHLGIPHSTAKTRIRDGLRALAHALDPGMASA